MVLVQKEIKAVYTWVDQTRLPAEYQEVEYIETNASWTETSSTWQVIDTWYIVNPNTKISIDLQCKSLLSQSRLFWCYSTNSSYVTFNAYIDWSLRWSRCANNWDWQWQSTFLNADTNRHTFVLDNVSFQIYTNWTQVYNNNNSYNMSNSASHSLPLFALWSDPHNQYWWHLDAKIYWCKIYNNNSLTRDFVPCYRKSDSVIWMYDIVNNQFYTNTGTWTFTKGSDVPSLVEKQIRPTYKYLCFTANSAGSTVKLQKTWSPTSVTLETSTDWETRTTYTFGSTITLSNTWDKVYWRNTSETDTWFSTNNSAYYQFVMSWSIAASWDIWYLLNKNSTFTVSNYAFRYLFKDCTALTTPPRLPAVVIWQQCYNNMFSWCTNLEALPALPAPALKNYCYGWIFYNCSKIKISTTQTWEYQTPYRIPTEWTWTDATSALWSVFSWTWWTYTWNATINTTYYTSNTVVS